MIFGKRQVRRESLFDHPLELSRWVNLFRFSTWPLSRCWETLASPAANTGNSLISRALSARLLPGSRLREQTPDPRYSISPSPVSSKSRVLQPARPCLGETARLAASPPIVNRSSRPGPTLAPGAGPPRTSRANRAAHPRPPRYHPPGRGSRIALECLALSSA